MIKIDIAEPGELHFLMFDEMGRVVYSQNENVVQGSMELNLTLSGLSNGMYFYRMEINGFTDTRKLLLMAE